MKSIYLPIFVGGVVLQVNGKQKYLGPIFDSTISGFIMLLMCAVKFLIIYAYSDFIGYY